MSALDVEKVEKIFNTVDPKYLNDYGTPGGAEYHVLKLCRGKHVGGCSLYRARPELIREMLSLGAPHAWRWRYIDHHKADPTSHATLGLTFYINEEEEKDVPERRQ